MTKNNNPKTTIVDIIGSGRVANHLLRAFNQNPQKNVDANLVNPRTLLGARPFAQIALIAVSDNAIEQVAAKLNYPNAIIAHTSGSTPIDILKPFAPQTGVFYPLQTFSLERKLEYSKIPFFIEGSSKQTADSLAALAASISNQYHIADSQQRKALHVAAVFACNFTNHLWAIADTILNENGLTFEMIRPLLEETLNKTNILSPLQAQTGPAARGDSKTIEAHRQFLASAPDLQNLYSLLSSSIQNLQNKNHP